MVNKCLLHTGELMFHLFLLLYGAKFQPDALQRAASLEYAPHDVEERSRKPL